jgi:hypothetical protein
LTSVSAAGPSGRYRDGLYAESKGSSESKSDAEEKGYKGCIDQAAESGTSDKADCDKVLSCSQAAPKSSRRHSFGTNYDAAGPRGDFKQGVWVVVVTNEPSATEAGLRNSPSSKEDEIRAPEQWPVGSPMKHRAFV